MGFTEQRFTKTVDEEFRCPICRDIVEEPVTSQCEHVYCKACIHEWLSRESTCPVDRKPLKVHHLNPISRFYRVFYSKLQLKCGFESIGCDIVCKVEEIKTHENKCEFNPNIKHECINGCKAMITKSQATSHNCVHYLMAIIDEKSEQISRMSDRETEIKRKLLDFQITIETKNSEINYLNERLFEKLKQSSDKCPLSLVSPSTMSTSSYTTENNVYKFKLLLIGDKGVGKTSVLLRFIENRFMDSNVCPINGYRSRTLELDDRIIDLQIWGNSRQFSTKNDFKDLNAIMFVFDVNKWQTFKNLNNYIKDIKHKTRSDVKRLLVGNKCDNIETKRVDYLSSLEMSRNCGIPFIEVSAKSGNNVEEAFYKIITQSVISLTHLRSILLN